MYQQPVGLYVMNARCEGVVVDTGQRRADRLKWGSAGQKAWSPTRPLPSSACMICPRPPPCARPGTVLTGDISHETLFRPGRVLALTPHRSARDGLEIRSRAGQ